MARHEVDAVLEQIERENAPKPKSPKAPRKRRWRWRHVLIAGGAAWLLALSCSESASDARIRSLESQVQQLRGLVSDLELRQHSH